MSPQRIQRRRTRGWRMPEGAIYVGRPTRWGNPCDWTSYPKAGVDDDGEPYTISAAANRRFAVVCFEDAVLYGNGAAQGYPSGDEIRKHLAGKDLACWCPLDQPCHADVLLRIANKAARP